MVDKKDAIALNTSLAASRILSIGAQRISASLDTFSGWLLAGFGAAFGLMLANLQSATQLISLGSLKSGAAMFLVAAAFGASQKLVAVYVLSSVAAAEDGKNLGKELAENPVPLDVSEMYKQVNEGLLWPWSTIGRQITQKAQSGDYAVSGRIHARASQIQSYIVAVQATLSIWSAVIVVSGIAI
jgi:hypothetical protein